LLNKRTDRLTYHPRCGTWGFGALPKLLTVEVFADDLVCSISEEWAEEWHAHDKETRTEHRLSLGKLNFALVGTVWRADLAQVSVKFIKGTRWAPDNGGAGTIMERYTSLRLSGRDLLVLEMWG
jgi:hypothetical protein